MRAIFRDRRDAGRKLAEKLLPSFGQDTNKVVLALPRGGVPVAFEVAKAIGAPLDVFVARKLGVPGHEELAMGAIATGSVTVIDQRLVDMLGISAEQIDDAIAREQKELARREQLYRGNRAPAVIEGRTVILVDDGLASGSSMRAALRALRAARPTRVVIAVPVSAPQTCAELGELVDGIVCAETPEPFYAVGIWYADFSQTSDEEVEALLSEASGTPERFLNQPAARSGSQVPAGLVPIDVSKRAARPFDQSRAPDYSSLMQTNGHWQFILLGEASHGTREFYRTRAEITKRLILEQGLKAVAVEADWPDAYRVNRYVRGLSEDENELEALSSFERFPLWTWRNSETRDFIAWLRAYNDRQPNERDRVGFYGLDLYSLHRSVDEVLRYLERIDPEMAHRAKSRYESFEDFSEDAPSYGYAASLGLIDSCERAVVAQLVEMQQQSREYRARDGRFHPDDHFYAEQNARLLKNAEQYYRVMYRGYAASWNLRDEHMVETLDALSGHLAAMNDSEPRIAVWAHNSHLGDARATELRSRGELNLGQLVRERHPGRSWHIGFTTYSGTVTAASDWDSPPQKMRVPPALPESYEALFHEIGIPQFVMSLRQHDIVAALDPMRLERAIGVIYRPKTERASHYFLSSLPQQFDAVIHIDETHALEPLDRIAGWETEDVAETFPTGL